MSVSDTAKNAQVETSLTSFDRLDQQADVRMPLQVVGGQSIASSQQSCSKLIVKTCVHRLAASCFNKL